MRPNEDERVLSALAHGGIIANIFNLAGVIGAALIWSTQRERSAFVRGHALQSLAYQVVVLVTLMLLVFMWSACLLISLLPAALRPELYSEGGPPDLFWVALLGALVPVVFGVAATVYALYGALRAYRGADFRYILVGRFAGPPTASAPSAPAATVATPLPPPSVAVAPPLPTEPMDVAPPPVAVAPPAPTDPTDMKTESVVVATDPADTAPPVAAPPVAQVPESVPEAAAPTPSFVDGADEPPELQPAAPRRRTRRTPPADTE